MIELQAVRKSYRRGRLMIPVLKEICLLIEKGEFLALMGPSGSGKSTLLNIIGCLDRIDGGSYRCFGIDMGALSDDDLSRWRNEKMGLIFQVFNLIPRISARRNVELPMVYQRLGRNERRRRALEALEQVGLEEFGEYRPMELSGGQQQRVAIARALVSKPELIIADEPTGSLDSKTGREIMEILEGLNNAGTTIVVVTHEAEVAKRAQRVINLVDGCIA